MTDHTFASVADAYRAWQDSRSPDIAQAEARIDALLANLSEQSRELADLYGWDVFVRAQLGHAINTIERQQETTARQQREIVRLQAEIARMRTDPARRPTRTESIVRALGALYAQEGE